MAIVDARGFQLVPDGSQFNQGIGNIINQVIANRLQPQAMGGDPNALARLSSVDPNRANAVGGILRDQRQQQELQRQQEMQQQQMQQEMLSRVARGYATAKDKRGFLSAASDQLRSAGMEDLAMQVQEDLDEYVTNPSKVDAEYNAAFEMFGTPDRNATPARVRELELLTQNLTPEQQEKARLIELGLEGRASGAGMKSIDIGGVPHVFDPRTGGYMPAVRGDQAITTDEVAGSRETIKQAEARGGVVGKAEGEREVNAPKAAAGLRSTLAKIDNTLEKAQAAKENVSVLTAGAGGRLLANFAGTKATDLRKTIDTLKASLSFDALSEMRANSPTGGALGSITERELDLLSSAVSSLDTSQSPEQLKESINRVIEHYNSYKDLVNQAYSGQYGDDAQPAPKRLKYNPATGKLE